MRAPLLRLISRATNLNVEVNKAKKRGRKLNCQKIRHILHVIFKYDLSAIRYTSEFLIANLILIFSETLPLRYLENITSSTSNMLRREHIVI